MYLLKNKKMDLNELIVAKEAKITEMRNLIEVGKAEKRELSSEEKTQFENLENEIRGLESEINKKNNNNNNKIEIKNNMENFLDKIVRNGDKVENFSVRAIELATSLDDVQVAGNLSVVGYQPFYQQMGVEVLPNLTTSLKLPYVAAITAGKPGEGNKTTNSNTPATVSLQPSRYTIQETIGKEILAVGNENALQAFLFEMAKGVDRAITKDVYDVAKAAGTSVTGLTTGYTTTDFDKLSVAVDGEVTFLFPRSEFYKAKGTKVDSGSGLFVANKTSEVSGNLWDGTKVFYSQLFTGTTIVASALNHITVGEWGNQYEVIFDQYTKAGEGQVVVTVAKIANVVSRNASATVKGVMGS